MRARNIKPGFYRNEDLAECSPWARLLFPGLWMLADRAGRLEYRPKRWKAELFPYDNVDTAELCAELLTHGLVKKYQSGGVQYLWIPKFLEHQNPHCKEAGSVLPPHPEEQGSVQHSTGTVQAQCEHGASTSSARLIPDSLIPDSLIPESSTHESLVNQDHARALNVAGDETGEHFTAEQLQSGSGDEPCIEFVELREYWDRECRAEGPLTGWQEYKQLKAARQWPGMGRIAQDVAERYASGAWEKGFAKALGNYLRERYWLAEVKAGPQKQPRASPRAPTEAQRRMAEREAQALKRMAARGLTREGRSHEHGAHDCGQVVDITDGVRNIPLGR